MTDRFILCGTTDILEAIRSGSTGSSDMPDADRLSMGRALAINELVQQSAQVFQQHMAAILEGGFHGSLVHHAPAAGPCGRAKSTAFRQVFNSERVLELEAAGYRAIQGLLDVLVNASTSPNPGSFDQHVRKLTKLQTADDQTMYKKLLDCTDKVSGMTDRYCIELFRKLSGHALGF